MGKSEILHQHLGMACRQPLHESWEMENGLDRFFFAFFVCGARKQRANGASSLVPSIWECHNQCWQMLMDVAAFGPCYTCL